MTTTRTKTNEPQTTLKRSADAIRGAHFNAGTEPSAKERATILAAERVEDIHKLLRRLVAELPEDIANIEAAGTVALAVSATRSIAATDRFRRLQQLADELVGIWCVEDGLR